MKGKASNFAMKMNPVHGETTDKLFLAFTLQTSLTASLKQNESSSPVSKSCSTGSVKGKASIVAARSLCVETPLTKVLILILVYTLQTSSATSLTALEMKESSSPVSKRSSTGSVKGKVSIVTTILIKKSAGGNPATYTDSCFTHSRLAQLPP